MSLASEIIQDAYDSIGRGSELLTTDTSLTDKGLRYLRSRMEFLRKNDIILEETVSGVTTTIALPDDLTDELNEPAACTIDLINYLAVYIAAQSRTNVQDFMLPTAQFSYDNMARLYRVHDIPNKHTSKLLPRGQGSGRGQVLDTFFNGQELANDVD